MNDFERCVKERRLIKIKPSNEMIQKEIESAEYDLERARNSLMKKISNGLMCNHIIPCFTLQKH